VAIENAALYESLQVQAGNLERMVKARTADLAQALEDARVAERMKSQFVADVSHELRTPLTNMRLYIDLLNFGNPERFSDYLKILTRETDRLVILIEDLLAISSLGPSAANPNLYPMDLNPLVRDLVGDRQRLLSEKSLDVHLALMEELPLVMADENMISKAIAHLITNAMHYTKPGGGITIETKGEKDNEKKWVTVNVSDTGIGIPPDEHARVFERFYRGSASRLMPVPGTGLGLAICNELVEQHGGKITLESEVNEGSEFTIWLPVYEDE
jgi:signal transduction histidine kinase